MCDKRLNDGPLVCTGSGEGHTHTFVATAGADLDEEAHHAREDDQ